MEKTHVAILETWTERERGWGSRPDGGSLHLSKGDYRIFLEKYDIKEKQRNPSGITPDEYSKPDNNPKAVYVSQELYNKLIENIEDSGIWIVQSELGKKINNKEIEFIV